MKHTKSENKNKRRILQISFTLKFRKELEPELEGRVW
jgi:hypothetical protein